MRVATIKDVGDDIRAFEFEPTDGNPSGPHEAGAHIDVYLPNGLIRQYSLINYDTKTNRYHIAVKCEHNGRGGSKAMHELQEGDVIKLGPVRNNFMLYENADKFILIAGGIGLTPMLSMANRLKDIRKPFELHLCARNEKAIPFAGDIKAGPLADHTAIHLDTEDGRSSFDIDTTLGKPNEQALIYICGPQGFMTWLKNEAMARGWKEENIRIESFSAPIAADVENHTFSVELAKTGQVIEVNPQQTVLDALHHAGLEVPYACMQGTCGTCIAPVLDGEIDHRDAYLSDSEKAANNTMCLCVSRAVGEKLVVDI